MATGNYAIITNGVISNVIVLDPDNCGGLDTSAMVPVDDVVPRPGPGWSYDGHTWTPGVPE